MLSRAGAWVFGADVGGTKVLAGIADLSGTPIITREVPTAHGADAPVIRQIGDIARELAGAARLPLSGLAHATVGLPAAVARSGLVSLAAHLSLPDDRPIAPILADVLGSPTTVENDVNLAALGEALAGEGRGAEGLAFAAFGTGVGLGIVVNGAIVHGRHGRAGEIALLPVGGAAHARSHEAAESGPFEALVGSPGIRRRYGSDAISVAEIFNRADAGEARASEIIAETAAFAAEGLAAVLAILDPDVLVVGGGIGMRPRFLDAVRHHLGRLLPGTTAVVPSALGREAGLMGALQLAARTARRQTASHSAAEAKP